MQYVKLNASQCEYLRVGIGFKSFARQGELSMKLGPATQKQIELELIDLKVLKRTKSNALVFPKYYDVYELIKLNTMSIADLQEAMDLERACYRKSQKACLDNTDVFAARDFREAAEYDLQCYRRSEKALYKAYALKLTS